MLITAIYFVLPRSWLFRNLKLWQNFKEGPVPRARSQERDRMLLQAVQTTASDFVSRALTCQPRRSVPTAPSTSARRAPTFTVNWRWRRTTTSWWDRPCPPITPEGTLELQLWVNVPHAENHCFRLDWNLPIRNPKVSSVVAVFICIFL